MRGDTDETAKTGSTHAAHGRMHARAGRTLAVVVAWGLVAGPRVAQACAVCTAGRDEENAAAFLATTIFMSLMPLVAVGTLIFVIWRRIRKLEAASEADGHREGEGAGATPGTSRHAVPAAAQPGGPRA